MRYTIYLAGGLFGAGEQLHLLHLEHHLKKLGREVILPLRESLKHVNNGTFDLEGVAKECLENARDPANIVVACIDGSDADSGTAFELGIACASVGRAVVYRTDVRTALDREVGINAMLLAGKPAFHYHPANLTDLRQVGPYYRNLAQAICRSIEALERLSEETDT